MSQVILGSFVIKFSFSPFFILILGLSIVYRVVVVVHVDVHLAAPTIPMPTFIVY